MGLVINHSKKFGFVHIPKTGGTSITHILKKSNGTEGIAIHDSTRLLTNVDDYFIFTFVRNPFTRLTSSYFHVCRQEGFVSFGDFIKNINLKDMWYFPQSYYINSSRENDNKISFIGKYENFTNDVNYVLKTIGFKYPIPHLNRHPLYEKHPNLKQQNYYKYIYTEEWMKDWVRERYENDFKIFNYELDF